MLHSESRSPVQHFNNFKSLRDVLFKKYCFGVLQRFRPQLLGWSGFGILEFWKRIIYTEVVEEGIRVAWKELWKAQGSSIVP